MISIATIFDRILLLTPPSQPGQEQPNMLMSFLPIILIFGVFYLFIIRPQKKRQQQREALVNTLEKGDKVITSSGIHGTVSQMEEKRVLVQVAEGTKLWIEKSHVNAIPKEEK